METSGFLISGFKGQRRKMHESIWGKAIRSPITFGIAAGVLAVFAPPILDLKPSQAYGICTVCHARDILSWVSNALFGASFEGREGLEAMPLLTTAGLIAGAMIASKIYGEYRLGRSENYLKMLLLGLCISNIGLLIFSCPTRIVLRLAYGDPFSILSLVGLLGGIAISVGIMKWRSRT